MIETWRFEDVVHIPTNVKVKWDYFTEEQIAHDYKINVPDGVDRREYIKAYILANLVVL